CIVNDQGHILETNVNWKKTVFTHTTQNQKLLDLFEDEVSKDLLSAFFVDTYQSELKIDFCRLKDKQGNMRWFDFRITKKPGYHSYHCTFRDITRKKLVQSILDQISDQCNIGYWEYNSSNNYFGCSSMARQILGESAS